MEKMENFLFKVGKLTFSFHPATWDWIRLHSKAYALLVVIALLAELLFISLAIFVPWRAIPAAAFLLAIVIMVISYIPTGLAATVIHAENIKQTASSLKYHLYPSGLRKMAGWLAVLGWLGVVHNPWLNFWTVTVGIFLFFIFEAFGSKKKKSGNSIVVTAVVLMTIWVGWSYVSPDSHNTFVRYYESWLGITKAEQHRVASANQVLAAISYARPLQPIKVLYNFNLIDGELSRPITPTNVNIAVDSLLKIYDYKDVRSFEGQLFIRVQIPVYASYVNSYPYWVEADYIEIISPSQVQKENKDKNRKKEKILEPSLPTVSSVKESYTLHQGEVWGPDKYFQAGESFTLVVEYAEVENIQFSGENRKIYPGTHKINVTTPGVPAFQGVSPLAKVTVIY